MKRFQNADWRGHASSGGATAAAAVTPRLLPGRLYLLVWRQAVEACAPGTPRQRRTPEDIPSVAEAGAQRHGPGSRSAVESSQATAGPRAQ